jgi:ATP-dependent DNA helicase RecG
MSQKEVREIFRETTDVLFESLNCPDITLENISLGKVRTFLKESGTSYKISKATMASVLASIGVFKNGKLNNAGALMFADDINQFIPYSETILAAFKGIDKTYIYDRKDVRDDLLTQLNEAMAFLKKHLNVRSEIRELNRYDIYEIPLDALREALVNALVHRDYSMRGTNISVNVFDNRVEIVNPGGFVHGLSKENFGKESVRRNLIVADLFHRMDKMERVGSGIGRMRTLMKEANLKEPLFESDTFFRVVFYRNPKYALKTVDKIGREESKEKSSEIGSEKSSEKILEIIRTNKYISARKIAEKLCISSRAVEKQIARLKNDGLLKRVGSAKGGWWEIASKEELFANADANKK